MRFREVELELFASVEDLAALVFGFGADFGVNGVGGGVITCCGGCWWWFERRVVASGLSAFPGFALPMDGVFVALPVVFAAEATGTIGVCAAVGAGVSLFVFPVVVASLAQSSHPQLHFFLKMYRT